MSATIKPIDGRSIHQIQSGQVIVDLCSVVKELVENSLDSGAGIIDVRFKNQGLDLIEVQDNGSGIAPANYASIALKHHTSKLSSYSDIASLETFGFRGEALASLCALSNLAITTCLQAEVPKGARLTFEPSGKLRDTAVVATQRGTIVAVDRLFHNLPVRRRELERNVKREWHKVIALLNQYACIKTGVKFSVSQQPTKGKRIVLFSTKGNPTTRDNIINIFGAKTLSALVPLDLDLELEPSTASAGVQPESASNKVRVVGHVSRPSPGEGRQTPDRQMFFVNGRPCSLPQVAKAFNEVYRSYNYSQSPFILADMQLDTHMYDVNVSPDKRTILLHDQGRLLDRLRSSLTALFDANDHVVPVSQVADHRLHTTVEASSNKSRLSALVGRETATEDKVVNDSPSSGDEEDHSSETGQESEDSPTVASIQPRIAEDKPSRRQRIVHDQNLISQWLSPDSQKPAQGPSTVPRGEFAAGGNDPATSHRRKPLRAQPTVSLVRHDPESRTGISVSPLGSPRDSVEGLAENTTTAGHDRPSSSDHRQDAISPDRVAKKQHATIEKLQYLNTEHGESERPHSPLPKPQSRPHWPFGGDNCANEEQHSPSGDDDIAESDTYEGHVELPSASNSGTPRVGTDPSFNRIESRLTERMTPSEAFSSPMMAVAGSHPHVRKEASLIASLAAEASEEFMLSSEGDDPTHRRSPGGPEPTTTDQIPHHPVRPLAFGIKRTDPTVSITRWLRTDEEAIWYGLNRLMSTITSGKDVLPGARDVEDIASSDAESKLSLIISRGDFSRMRVVGQFNMGFIIAVRPAPGRGNMAATAEHDELFIIDQHASDEKYNFERLQANTTVQSQRLVHARALQLTALEEEIVMENVSAVEANGFKVEMDVSGDSPVGSRCRVVALPLSRETTFTMDDLQELIALLGEESAESSHVPRPSKVRRMFAMRACRSSIMIGKALTGHQMSNVLKHMGELDKPWNCPHGRPTMRHLCHLDAWDRGRWKHDVAAVPASVWRSYARSEGLPSGNTPASSQSVSA
ncbi:hypothetical protein PLIIFM63780_004654 [Purpureocillium lilacinum]|nr:hypothetical protein PLIIFM63780_004654 [Purpureocillium lilacinum]